MSLRDDAFAIFRAALDAVAANRLVGTAVSSDDQSLTIAGRTYEVDAIDSLLIVGGGKAGVGMVDGLLAALVAPWRDKVRGLLSVPADCVDDQNRPVDLVAGRAAGVNEPSAEGVTATSRMKSLLEIATGRNLVLVLLSGGGSALLPLPRAGITLEDKQAITRQLARGGADITQLNAVRRQLSDVKAGGLIRGVHAAAVHTLVISDVIGSDPATIASGPTVPVVDPAAAAEAAVAVLDRFGVGSPAVRRIAATPQPTDTIDTPAYYDIIGSNQTAVDAALAAARAAGYDHVVRSEFDAGGEANALGGELAELVSGPGRSVAVSGGEPVVHFLKPPGKGGRNQQLALAALRAKPDFEWWRHRCLLSAGTDGEDGPTDAAGGLIDYDVAVRARSLDLEAAWRASAAYDFLDRCGGLIHTGPTHTNVMDLRIVLSDLG